MIDLVVGLLGPWGIAAAVAVAGAAFAWFVILQQRKGAERERARQVRENARVISRHEGVRHETGTLSDDDLDRDNAPWVRGNGSRP